MAGITLAQAGAQLTAWLAASTAVAAGQSYTISVGGSSRTMTRADAAAIQKQITFWDRQVKRLTRGGLAIKGATPA